jgi:hypothetical protein
MATSLAEQNAGNGALHRWLGWCWRKKLVSNL